MSAKEVKAGWFEVVEGESLLQGDVLCDCPIPRIAGFDRWPFKEGETLEVDIGVGNACVLSQSCDLENDKVDEVLFGQVVDWPSACRAFVDQGNEAAKSGKFRKALIDGNVPGIALLRKSETDPPLDWSIVDFHRLFVLPKEGAMTVARNNGKRLRLSSPYREHLGQSFARYFMRVGLPLDADEFEIEGKVAVTTK